MLAHDPPVPQTAWMLAQAPPAPADVAALFRLNLAREAFRAKILAHWAATRAQTATGRPVDAVLSPVAPTLAPPHDATRWWGYTSYWNLMDYPAAVFPVGRLRAEEYFAASDGDGAPSGRARNPTEEIVQAQWDPETYDNASIGLQLIGRRLNEEKLLGMLCKVEDAIRSHPCQ